MQGGWSAPNKCERRRRYWWSWLATTPLRPTSPLPSRGRESKSADNQRPRLLSISQSDVRKMFSGMTLRPLVLIKPFLLTWSYRLKITENFKFKLCMVEFLT